MQISLSLRLPLSPSISLQILVRWIRRNLHDTVSIHMFVFVIWICSRSFLVCFFGAAKFKYNRTQEYENILYQYTDGWPTFRCKSKQRTILKSIQSKFDKRTLIINFILLLTVVTAEAGNHRPNGGYNRSKTKNKAHKNPNTSSPRFHTSTAESNIAIHLIWNEIKNQYDWHWFFNVYIYLGLGDWIDHN